MNTFDGPESLRTAFIAEWETMGRFLRQEPGFVRARLCESPHADGRFLLTAIVEWTSAHERDTAYAKLMLAPLITSGAVRFVPRNATVVRDVIAG